MCCAPSAGRLSQVKILIVGQDPYPTPGHPVGLSFSWHRMYAPSRAPCRTSMPNCTQIWHQAGCQRRSDAVVPQGVLLLNRVLTVQPGRSGSHRGKGWEQVTQRPSRPWSVAADRWSPSCGGVTRSRSFPCSALCLTGERPSLALIRSAGFFGSRPFSARNELLARPAASRRLGREL
jgi:uracil-DNA glycosylase